MKVIVITKSDKNGGLCVAGINIENGSFVRLVSDNNTNHYAIPKWCMRNVEVLDIIDVSVIHPVPSFCQQENMEVKLQQWTKVEKVPIETLFDKINNKDPYIFNDSCFYLDESIAQSLQYSIIMVKVRDLIISKNQYDKTKASFLYNGVFYSNMSITDPDFYNIEGKFDNAILVISIPDIGHSSDYYMERRCYKFVSKIYII